MVYSKFAQTVNGLDLPEHSCGRVQVRDGFGGLHLRRLVVEERAQATALLGGAVCFEDK